MAKLPDHERIARKKARRKAEYARNKEQAKADALAYYFAHRDACRAKKKKYREENREARLAADRKWRTENKERANASSKSAKEKNPEKYKEMQRAYRKKHKERLNPLQKIRTQKRRAMQKGAEIGDTSLIVKWEVEWRKKHVVRCYWCRKLKSPKKCHTDHIIPIAKHGRHCVSNLCISCGFCNTSKNAKSLLDWNKTLAQPVLL